MSVALHARVDTHEVAATGTWTDPVVALSKQRQCSSLTVDQTRKSTTPA
jgi:hypothetical protein